MVSLDVAGAESSVVVEFERPFSAYPAVVATVVTKYPHLWHAAVSDVTPTSFTLTVASSAGQTAKLYAYWVALL